jgi:hypothetical protein
VTLSQQKGSLKVSNPSVSGFVIWAAKRNEYMDGTITPSQLTSSLAIEAAVSILISLRKIKPRYSNRVRMQQGRPQLGTGLLFLTRGRSRNNISSRETPVASSPKKWQIVMSAVAGVEDHSRRGQYRRTESNFRHSSITASKKRFDCSYSKKRSSQHQFLGTIHKRESFFWDGKELFAD